MMQSSERAIESARRLQMEEAHRATSSDGLDTGACRGLPVASGPATVALPHGPRGSLRVQLTLVFVAMLGVLGAPLVVASCASLADRGPSLLSALVVASSLGLAATLAAWLVLGRALRPLEQLALSARDLDASWSRTSLDLTGDQVEVHRTRNALDAALKRLHEGHVALDLFVANVAHELQDPVATVLAEADGLRGEGRSVEALSGFASSAREEVARMGRIISGSLTLARLGSAQHHSALSPVCMSDIALDVVRNVHVRAERQDIRLVLSLSESDQLEVCADADLVTSMLENVVSNAVTHSPPGKEVKIRVDHEAEDLRITVRDHGPGVPEQLLPHICDAHVHGSRKSDGVHGMGLGLAIATRVARYHGGGIRIANHVDGGCEVVIALPLHRAKVLQR